MKTALSRAALALVACACLTGAAAAQKAASAPTFMNPISGTAPPPSASEVATRNVLQLNTSMFSLYDNASKVFRANFLAKHPVILALFSGAGGRMILYRPGQPPIEALPVPYLDNAADKSWQAPMRTYLTETKNALGGVDQSDQPDDWKPNSKVILQNNITFMEACLDKGVVSFDALQAFAKKQGPLLKLAVGWAASTQVEHWMSMLDGWKKMLGADWDKTYAASNTIYVARQNNVLFSVLAQYFGADAIDDRLLLIETTSFTTTPDELLGSVIRIVSDRSVGALFFDNYYLMDYELMGGDARKTIVAEMKKRGRDPVLPPLVPFGSRQWPMLISGGSGPATLDDLK
jgi:hypothetical protein